MSRRGFTLIELMVVIAIIALLASFILASVSAARQKATLAAAKQFDASTYHFLGDSIAGEWDFGECSGTLVHDISGFSHNGTLVNSPVWSTNTPYGTGCSLQFNGSNSYITAPIPYIGANAAFSVAAWLYLAPGAGAYPLAVASSDGFFLFGINIGSNSAPGFNLYVTSSPSVTQTANHTVPTTNTWHYVVGTYSNGTASIYVDGSLVSTGTGSSATPAMGGNLYLGNGTPKGNSYWLGNIDEVRIYSSTLTSMQVRELYAQEAPAHGIALRN